MHKHSVQWLSANAYMQILREHLEQFTILGTLPQASVTHH